MMKKISGKLTYANVMATLAVALDGFGQRLAVAEQNHSRHIRALFL